MNEPITAGEVAELLGITRQGVNYLFNSDPDFPKPIADLVTGRVWEQATIEQWAVDDCRICPEHRRPAIGKQVVAGKLLGRCSEDFLYDIDPRMVPSEPGPNARAPKIPEDM